MSSPATQSTDQHALPLPGLDGSNPLGFLAALGTLQTISAANPNDRIAMSWTDARGAWNPLIYGLPGAQHSLAGTIAKHVNCPFKPDSAAERRRESAQQQFDDERTNLKKAKDNLKKRRLRGEELHKARKEKIEPIEKLVAERRRNWLAALAESVPSPELSLGKHLNATSEEFRIATLEALDKARAGMRETVDLLASFGSDICVEEKRDQVRPTPFCFITGSGHQYFLDTVRQLTANLDASRFEEALFHRVFPSDEKLSMRWDPIEDRRYALMWDDPTAHDNKPRTNWALNMLAYRGLQMLPSMPAFGRLNTVGWIGGREPSWTWPIWVRPASCALVRSILSHPLMAESDLDKKSLAAIGVSAVYRSIRVQVGNPPLHKINFTPAQRIA